MVVYKLFMIFIEAGLFLFEGFHHTQYYSYIINNISLFVAVVNKRIAKNHLDTFLPNSGPCSELHSKLCMGMEVVCKLFMCFILLGQFSFSTIHPAQYYSSIINNMLLLVAVKNRKFPDIQSDVLFSYVGTYSE
jgi:hypothetical protein